MVNWTVQDTACTVVLEMFSKTSIDELTTQAASGGIEAGALSKFESRMLGAYRIVQMIRSNSSQLPPVLSKLKALPVNDADLMRAAFQAAVEANFGTELLRDDIDSPDLGGRVQTLLTGASTAYNAATSLLP